MSDSIEFQAFSWFVNDVGELDAEGSEDVEMVVHVFGKTKDGKSVSLHVRGFNPSFCVQFDDPKVPCTSYGYQSFVDILKTKLCDWTKNDDEDGRLQKEFAYEEHIIEPKEPITYMKTLWGYTHGERLPFYQLQFQSLKAYNKALSILRACHRSNMTLREMQMYRDEVEATYTEGNLKGGKPKYDHEGLNEYIKKYALETGAKEACLRWINKLADNELPLGYARGKLFEVIDPILRFAHMKNLKMAGWLKASNITHVESSSTCELEYSCTYDDLKCIETDAICPTIKEMAFDIEAYSYDDMFPDPGDERNPVYQIGITIKHYIDKKPQRLLYHCRTPPSLRGNNDGRCLDIPDTKVVNFETERDLLRAFAKLIVSEDPDLIYTYNGDMFDWAYLWKRSIICKCNDDYKRLSRYRDYECKLEEKKFQSSAYGDNKYERVDIPGRMNVDLMIWIQRNMPPDQYPSYALNAVAEKEIGERKRDVDAKEIFAAFRSGDDEQCTRIGDYCCQDTVLVQKLVNKLDVVTQMFEMSNITDTPPMYLLQKGQQIKVFSQICKMALRKGFFVPLAEDRDDSTFKGAIVLDPLTGMYHTPVAVLDFASLYPSIQVAYNVCYTTIVLDHVKYSEANLKKLGVKYDIIEWDDDILQYENKATGVVKTFSGLDEAKKHTPRKEIVANISRNDNADVTTWRWTTKHHRYIYVQNDDSVIPDLQVELKKSRKAVRRMMAPIEHSKDPEEQLRWRVLNGRQLAIKVSMNSIYGFTSAFMLNLMALSASVTAKGRQMINQTKNFMENDFPKLALVEKWIEEDVYTHYTKDGKEIVIRPSDPVPEGCYRKFPTAELGKTWANQDLSIRVVGGDSVTGDTPILCRLPNGQITYRTIDSLGTNSWQQRIDGKDYCLTDLHVWSDRGFTPVKHIIRHKTNKRIFRVSTHTGIVDVTEDHSLLSHNGDKISPKDVVVGNTLMHTDLIQSDSWTSSSIVCPKQLGKAFAENLDMTLPDIILNGSIWEMASFIDGYMAHHGGSIGFAVLLREKSKIRIAALFQIMHQLGYVVTLKTTMNHFTCLCKKEGSLESHNEIQSIVELQRTEQYVYDIETENHHFHVGPGRMIVHNTDSVFCNFPVSTLAETISLCHKAEVLLTEHIFARPPIEMEYEKTYMPLVIQKKKNYVGVKYEMDDKRFKVDYKGIAVKRRNYCPLVKEIFWNVIHPTLGVEPYIIMKDGKPVKAHKKVSWDPAEGPMRAVAALRDSLKRLENRQVDWDDLLISKSLKSTYKGSPCTECNGGSLPCKACKGKGCELCRHRGKMDCRNCGGRGVIVNQPHVQLVNRIKERDPGSEPKSGQRFSMVIVNDDTRSAELCARAEDPAYAKQMGLVPDFLFYLDQQIRKPLTTFLTVIGKQQEAEEVFDKCQKSLFMQLRQERKIKEVQARKAFFEGNVQQVPVLKAPKKATVSKADRAKKTQASHASLGGIFKPKS